MSELIDSFDRLKAEELHKTQAAQKEIVRLLQTLARKLEHMENPSRLNADRLAEMKSDLDFKQMQMGNSASTSERLGQELERRKQELQKIDTLDEKISVELRQLAERMVRATRARAAAAPPVDPCTALVAGVDVKRARHLPGPQEPEGDLAAAARGTERGQAAGHRPLRRTEGGGAARESEARRAQQPAHSRRPRRRARRARAGARARHRPAPRRARAPLRALVRVRARRAPTQAMRSHEERVFSSSDFITARSLETKYQPVADDCARFVRTLNQEVVRGLAQQPLMASDGA